jgi:hypothetical protein
MNKQLIVRIRNKGYDASLELRKAHEVVPDSACVLHPLLRLIDESGEDYLYPADFFIPIDRSKSPA